MIFNAVIDNTALVYLTHLHRQKPFFDQLRNLFHTVHIPSEVVNEYARGVIREPERNWLLNRIRPEQGFYRLCTSYDSFILLAADRHEGIDKGEAEIYAQFRKINAQVIISDDKNFVKALHSLDPTIRVLNTLHILCWLDIASFNVYDWNDLVRRIHTIRPFSASDLREAYMDILKRFSIAMPKKEISRKCGLKKILAV